VRLPARTPCPTATHFFCLAKKSKQKKATPDFSETPKNWLQNGKVTKLAALRQRYFLIHFEANFPAEKKGNSKATPTPTSKPAVIHVA